MLQLQGTTTHGHARTSKCHAHRTHIDRTVEFAIISERIISVLGLQLKGHEHLTPLQVFAH